MLPTLEEFRADAARCQSMMNRSLIVALASLVFLGAVAVVVTQVHPDLYYADNAVLPKVYVFGGTVIVVAVIVAWASYIETLQKRFRSLSCGSCKESLLMGRRLVIASANCPKCGRRVIEKNQATLNSSTRPLVSILQFNQSYEAYHKQINRTFYRGMLVGVVVMFSSAGISYLIKKYISEVPADFFPAIVILFVYCPYLLYAKEKAKQFRHDYPVLTCSCCLEFVGGSSATIAAAKCCPNCGKTIIESSE